MSLDYDYSAVKDRKAIEEAGYLKEDGVSWVKDPDGHQTRLTGLGEAMVWSLMSIGIGTISEGNVNEVFVRLHMMERTTGAMRQTANGPLMFSLDDVQKLVGLRTNVSTLTKAQFEKKLITRIRNDAENMLDSYQRRQHQERNV